MLETYTINELGKILETFEGRFETMEVLMRHLVRQKLSNKQEKLMDGVIKRGAMSVKQVMDCLNISRTYALTLMERLGKEIGFAFFRGNREMRFPSRIVYDQSKVLKHQYTKIKELFSQKDYVTFHDLINVFATDLNGAKVIAHTFVSMNNGYGIHRNRVVKTK